MWMLHTSTAKEMILSRAFQDSSRRYPVLEMSRLFFNISLVLVCSKYLDKVNVVIISSTKALLIRFKCV